MLEKETLHKSYPSNIKTWPPCRFVVEWSQIVLNRHIQDLWTYLWCSMKVREQPFNCLLSQSFCIEWIGGTLICDNFLLLLLKATLSWFTMTQTMWVNKSWQVTQTMWKSVLRHKSFVTKQHTNFKEFETKGLNVRSICNNCTSLTNNRSHNLYIWGMKTYWPHYLTLKKKWR